ncbi:MAG: ATP-binding protein [Hydrogenophaga sp.]|uniref:ATP-binding protein n=1 Tax=Hydrogenophaga sp. TaxID=1904254 RepID=UPI003D9B1A14
MKTRWRSMALVVVLFTALAVAMVWGLSLRLQGQLREQMLQQADARALQLADAMGGQTQAFTRLIDHSLLDLRERWPSERGTFAQTVDKALQALPPGLVSHVTVVDAQGTVVFNSLGVPPGTSMADRPHFQALRDGGDQLVLGEPVQARLNNRWLFIVGRPILRDGRFDGAVHVLVSTEFLAGVLGRLNLTPQDVVALAHPQGRILARSVDNLAAMTQTLPASRPFLVDRQTVHGTFRETGAVDGVTRLYGWHRMMPIGAVVVVGLSEDGVLAPLAHTRQQATLLTALLSLALAGVGFWIGWLQWRLERGQIEMRQSRERLQEAQQVAHVGHWTFDASTRQMQWSDEVSRILGHDPARLVPGFEAYWALVHPDERARLKKVLNNAMTDRADLDDVHRIVRPDGSERFVRLISLNDVSGHGQTYRGTLQDVTELREAQLALERVNNGLEQRVKARTRELRALNRELESFTYSVSHDLRTPLRSIHGFATLLQESEAERLSGEGKDFLRRIQESSRRMGLLITDLLSMAQHSRASMNPEWVDLSAMAQQVVAELERGEPQRQVRWDIAPGLRAQADPTLIRVVVQNLLGNAWKYTGQTADAHIRLYSTGVGEDGQVGFCVSDNGAGFDMAYVDQLFQPFKRLHAHHEFEGTGIGLATVARVVQRHGGRVRGEGAVGRGATFSFSLPLEPVRQFADSAPPLR